MVMAYSVLQYNTKNAAGEGCIVFPLEVRKRM
jgi:hypothetical protein